MIRATRMWTPQSVKKVIIFLKVNKHIPVYRMILTSFEGHVALSHTTLLPK